MNWLILTVACIILWGVTDILYKASFNKDDPLSYYKSFVWVGIVMAMAGFVMSNWSDTLLNSIKMVKDDVFYLVPLCLIYAFAWFFGLLGLKHLDASIVSTVENVEGALVTIIVYYYYLSSIYQNKLRSISRTAQAGFNSGDFEDMYFPLPPLEEQGRIVDAISSIWEMIDMITAEL